MLSAPALKPDVSLVPRKEVVRTREATTSDLDAMTVTIQRAFHNYPYQRYVMRDFDDARRHEAERRIARTVCTNALTSGRCAIANDGDGVILWWYNAIEIDREAIKEIKGEAFPTFLEIESSIDEAWKPNGPIAMIAFLGVHPEHQGEGLGKALLLEAIRRIEEDGRGNMPIHLHTSIPKNVQIYKKFGFAVEAEVKRDDLTFWIMIKKPTGA